MSKRLLVLDVEGTLFETKFKIPGTDLDLTVWQAIAVMLGPGAVSEEVESHRKWQTGKYPSYIDWMKDTIKIHKRHGLSQRQFMRVV